MIRRGRGWARDMDRRVRRMPGALRLMLRAFRLVASMSPSTTTLYFSLVALVSAMSVIQVLLAKLVLDALAASDTDRALLLAAFYAATLAVPRALDPLLEAINHWFEDRAVGEIDRRLMATGSSLPDLGHVERPAFQDELELLQLAPHYSSQMLLVFRNALGGGLTLVGVLILLGGLHPVLPLALLAVAAPALLIEGRLAALSYIVMADRSRDAREMTYYARLASTPDAAKEVRIFGLGPLLAQRYGQLFEAALGQMTRVRLSFLHESAIYSILHAAALGIGFWYVATEASVGRLSVGDLALYLNGIIQAEALLGELPGWFGQPYRGLLYTRALFRFVDTSRPLIALAPPGQGRAVPAAIRSGIELRRVSFRYPESGHLVLEDASFEIEAGKVTALVGANGAGKSTLVKLLTRMYDPTGGEILLDGEPLQAYDLESFRARVAVVYQDFARFALTLGDNVAVGAAPGQADGQVESAARWVGVDEIARKLPNGYETELTRTFEGGVDLSGGEWQKVALARGFVRQAALVILDEPTSALDADAEFRLFERFRELMRNRTGLLISHRFSTVRMADRIVVLDAGRILESGGHQELLDRRGRYAELFEMQAGRYS